MKARVLTLIPVLVAIGLFGCASHKVRALTPQPIEAYQVQATVNDVRIAAEPLETKAEAEGAFTLDVTTEGYVPILLVMENRSKDNMLFIKEEIELVDSQGNVLKAIPANVMAEEFEHNAMAMAILGFGIFSYMSAENANEAMVKDWGDKELPAEKVLMPYRKTHGVVYFDLGESLSTLPNSTLQIPLRNMRTGEIYSLKLGVGRGIDVSDVESTVQEKEEEIGTGRSMP